MPKILDAEISYGPRYLEKALKLNLDSIEKRKMQPNFT